METITFLQQYASPALDRAMLLLTDLGDQQAYIALLVIIYLAVSPPLARRLGIVLMLSFALNFHLKGIVDTPRPFALDPDVARGEAAVATAPGSGFPSGHAQGSATFWGYLARHVRRWWWWLLAATVVVGVSLSRVYLGLHVPIDIVGGIAIAVVVLAVAQLVERRLAGRWLAWLAGRGLARAARPLLFLLGLLLPLLAHLALPVSGSELIMGGLAAFLTAPMLIRHDLPVGAGRRSVAAAVGLVLVFAALVGSGWLPEAIKTGPVGGFARFLLIGYVGLALTPYLLRRFGLAPGAPGLPHTEEPGATPPRSPATPAPLPEGHPPASTSGVMPVAAPPSTTNSVPVE